MSKKYERKMRNEQRVKQEKEMENQEFNMNRNTKSRMHLQTENS
jgi:hypothetical protein